MIDVKGLNKSYGDKRGVSDIEFHIEKGEVVGLLGPNGAGKSTIMKMMAGYMLPTSGVIELDGVNIVENPKAVNQRIGFLAEIPPLYVDMSVVEYLEFICEIRGISKKERKGHMAEIMGLARISEVGERLIRNLSKGYRQRVGFAQALVGFPEILILDEPTVGLDPKQITEVRELIKRLSESHTIILSSHILSEITMTCKRVIIIKEGKIATMDTVENLANNHSHGYLLTCESKKEGAVEAMQAVVGVTDVTEIESTNATFKFMIKNENDVDVRSGIFRAMVVLDMPILEFKPMEYSLEDAFLQITNIDEGGEK